MPRGLIAILMVAFLLRALLAIAYPGIAHPDEIFQYQEPVHRLLTGLGVPSWEWVGHVRSWFVPALVFPFMAATRLFTDNPDIYRAVISCALAAAALPTVWVAYAWGREEGSTKGALVAGSIAAVWFQLVYFTAHLLMDTVATDLLLPALYAARAYRHGAGRRALATGSVLLGVLAFIRPQIAPILLIPAIATLLAARKRGDALLCLACGLIPLVALGLLDWITLGTPFQSVWLYTYINLFQVAEDFGTDPWYWYVKNTVTVWMIAIVPIAYFNWKEFSRFGTEVITALLIVALISVIKHKEPRFILPAQTVLLIVAAAGLARFAAAGTGFWRRPATLIAGTCVLSLALALNHPFLPVIQRSHTELMVVDRVMRDPQACGIYFLPRTSLLSYAGYTGSRNGIRLISDRFDTPAANLRHANYILTRMKLEAKYSAPSGFQLENCKTTTSDYRICVYRRPGGCDGVAK